MEIREARRTVKPWRGLAALLVLFAIFGIYRFTIGSRLVIVDHVGPAGSAQHR